MGWCAAHRCNGHQHHVLVCCHAALPVIHNDVVQLKVVRQTCTVPTRGAGGAGAVERVKGSSGMTHQRSPDTAGLPAVPTKCCTRLHCNGPASQWSLQHPEVPNPLVHLHLLSKLPPPAHSLVSDPAAEDHSTHAGPFKHSECHSLLLNACDLLPKTHLS